MNDDGKKIYDSIDIQQAYIAGLQIGRKEKWHDLRKNPKDLPNGYRAVLNQEGKTTIYDPNVGFLGLDGVEVIAWCEIPKYPIVHDKGNNECHCIKDGDLPKENQDLRKQVEELKAKIERLADCSNCKHWDYSTRLLAYFCDCSDKISDSIDSRTYEHCDKWELE